MSTGPDDVDLRFLLQRLHLIGRDFGDEVEFARAQTRDAGGEFRNFHEDHVVGRRLLAPVAVKAGEFDAVARAEFDDLVGARADGLLDPVVPTARGFVGFLRDDFGHASREAAFDQRVGRLHRDLHGVVVDLLDFLQTAEEFPGVSAARSLFAREAFGTEGEDHVVGGKGRAVMEDDALTELEFDRFRGDALPGFRKTGGESARLLIGVHERFVDRIDDAVRGIGIEALRFDRGGKLRHGDHHAFGRSEGAGAAGGEKRGGDDFLHLHEGSPRDVASEKVTQRPRPNVRFCVVDIISNGFDNPVTTS